MKWTTICFDLDNTLYSHEAAFKKAIHFCYEELLTKWKRKGLHFVEVQADKWFLIFKENCDRYWPLFEQKQIPAIEYRRLRYKETMEVCHLPYIEEEADQFQLRYYEIVSRFCERYPQVDKCFEFLHSKGIKVAIITNGNDKTQKQKIKQIGLEPWLPESMIFTSENLGLEKPNRDIFDHVLFQIEGVRNKALYIGDAWAHDIVGALNAGWDAIYLNTRNEKPTTAHTPFSICHQFSEVFHIIRKEMK